MRDATQTTLEAGASSGVGLRARYRRKEESAARPRILLKRRNARSQTDFRRGSPRGRDWAEVARQPTNLRYSVGTPRSVIAALKIPNRPSPATSPEATAKLSFLALDGLMRRQATNASEPKKITSE